MIKNNKDEKDGKNNNKNKNENITNNNIKKKSL